MGDSHFPRVSARTGWFLGALILMAGMVGTIALVAAPPVAQAASAFHPSAPGLERVPVPAAASSSLGAARRPEPLVGGNGWDQVNETYGPSGSSFGDAVAISGDTMVVGAESANSGIGAAFVYTGSGSTWSEEAELTPSDGAVNDSFGYSVAVSSGTIVVGSPDHSTSPLTGEGAAYVFENGGSYAQEAELIDPGAATNDFFGGHVATLSMTSVVVSAPFEEAGEGAVFVYTKHGSSWPSTPTDTLGAPGGTDGYGDIFGEGLAVSASTLVIGAPGSPGATPPSTCSGSSAGVGCSTGAAYVYKDTRGTIVEQAKLTAWNGEGCSQTCSSGVDDMGGDYFGWSVAVQGNTVAVSSPWASQPPAPDGGTSDAPSSTGAAYVFTKSGTNWAQQQEIYDPAEVASGVQDWFGWAIAVMPKSSIVVTAPYDPEGSSGNGTGAAFVFPKTGDTWATYPTELTALDGAPGNYFGDGEFATIGRNYIVVGAPGTADGNLYFFNKT
jgi:hypothetical protein